MTGITVVNPGGGYTSAPTVTISPALPSYVTSVSANPTIYKNGVAQTLPMIVNTIAVTAGGHSYTLAPVVTITPASGDTTGTGATATATLSGGSVSSITITLPGACYTKPPTVTITRASGDTTGTGATATATIGPFWTNSSHQWPYVVYQLPTQASSTDVLTFSAPSGWLTTSAGSLPAVTLAPITNFVGQLETAPVGWGYCSFGTNHGVMGLGINVAWPNSDSSRPYYQSRNWMHRATRSWAPPAMCRTPSRSTRGGTPRPSSRPTGPRTQG